MSAPICFVDTETDGVHPGRKVWEVAIIRREPDGQEDEWSAFVDIDLSTADPAGLRIGRFYERHPRGQVLATPQRRRLDSSGLLGACADVAEVVARMTYGAVIVGINPGFDTAGLDQFLRANGLAPAWDYTPVCAKTFAYGFLAGRGTLFLPRWKTEHLADVLGIPPIAEAERHTALGDARFAQRVFDAVLGVGGAS